MSDSETPQTPEENPLSQVTDEFKNMIKEWLKMDDEIRECSKKVKKVRKAKKEAELFILDFMEEIKLPALATSDGSTLRRSVTKTKATLKQEIIQNALVEYTKDVQKAMAITKYILDKRPTIEKISLKRTMRKR
jgi:hypothetical protein